MSEVGKKRWLLIAEIALALLITALLVATWLPAMLDPAP